MFTLIQTATQIQLNDPNGYQADIFPFGALLNRFAVQQADKTWHNVIAAFQSPEDAQVNITQLFRSAKLSPFVCRLANAEYPFSGCFYRVNKHQLGNCAIHGLLYDAPFVVQDTHADAHRASVQLCHTYRGDNAGYPFAYQIQVHYELREHGQLSVQTTIHNIGDCAMPIADGWHPYFAVDGDMADWQLHIRSREQLAFNAELLPTGERITDTRFTTPTALAQTELDNCFVLDNDFTQAAVVLQGKHIRLTITPDASYPFVQAYTPPQRDCIALENLSSAPDAFNNRIGLLILPANEQYTFNTTYQLNYL